MWLKTINSKFLNNLVVLGAIIFEQMRNLGHERVVDVRLSEQRVDSHEQLIYADRMVPRRVRQNVHGQTTFIVDLRKRKTVPHLKK